MRIFITGGTGFIGRHVVKKLMGEGHEVALLLRKASENMQSGGHTEPDGASLQACLPAGRVFSNEKPGSSGLHVFPGRIHRIEGDLSDISKWLKQLKEFQPEAVLHLAWEGIPDYGEEQSAKNLKYGLNLLDALDEVGCKVFISTGSCWEYGADSGKLSEDAAANPRNPFAAAKAAFQEAANKWAQKNGAKYFAMRLFYVYGPGQKGASLIPHAIASAKRGIVPEIKNLYGGNDFIYVEDVADAVAQMIKNYRKLESSAYNVGSGTLTGVARIVNIVNGHFGLPGLAGAADIKPAGFFADISKIKKVTGWSPKTPIEEGIKKMIN